MRKYLSRMCEACESASFGDTALRKHLVQHLVQNLGLVPGCAPDDGRVEHGDGGEGGSQHGERCVEPFGEADGRCQRADHGGMGAGHAAGADQEAEVQPPGAKESGGHLDNLRQSPGAKRRPEPWRSEEMKRVILHNESAPRATPTNGDDTPGT